MWSNSSSKTGKAFGKSISPLVLARVGFYRIEDPEHFHTVRCAYCRTEISAADAYTSPILMHKKSSPNCPMVLGTVTESIGIAFRKTPGTGKQDHKSANKNAEEDELAIDEATAEKRVHPEQEDLAAMTQQHEEDVVLEIDEDSDTQAKNHKFRGPSSDVRARVYRDLERIAAHVDRSKQNPPVSNPQPKSKSQRKRVENIQNRAERALLEDGSGSERGNLEKNGLRKLSYEEIKRVFVALDKNKDGRITNAEFISGLKKNPWIAELLGMPANIRQVYLCNLYYTSSTL